MNGYLLVDKPKGWTSFDVVAKVRSIARANSGNKKIKVGHAGTLDPLATGLLILLLGSATKQQDTFMKLDKVYEAEIVLGSTSSTYDAEGEITKQDAKPVSELEVIDAVKRLTGKIEQTPPIYSAIKVDGKRAYKLAREGKEVELKSRSIEIYATDVISYEWPKLSIKTHVSSGTYIRTLTDDIGKSLSVGGYINNLRRISIGNYNLQNVIKIDDLNAETISKLTEQTM